MSEGRFVARRRLGLEWLSVLSAAYAVLVVGWYAVGAVAGETAGNRWILVAGAVLCSEVTYLWYHLRTTHAAGGSGPGGLGLANLVTTARAFLYAAAAGFLFVAPAGPLRWAPGACYGLGVLLDAVDGWVARTAGRTTRLGAKLDHAFDTLGFLVVPLVGVAWGRLPVVYLSISVARYLYLAGCWARRQRGRPVGTLPESRLRRPLAALQMCVVAVALLPVLPARVVLPAATVAVVPSLALFCRDYLAVTGRLGDRVMIE